MGFLNRLLRRFKKNKKIIISQESLPEMYESGEFSDLISGVRYLSTLDEYVCLECLKRDMTDYNKNLPKPPLHEGCRCILSPKVDLVGLEAPKRFSRIGRVPLDGGIYKAYLIERAEAIQNGINGESLTRFLREKLKELEKKYPKEISKLPAIKASIFTLYPIDDQDLIKEILKKSFSAHPDKLIPVLEFCASKGYYYLIDNFLKEVSLKSVCYIVAGRSVKKYSLEKAISYLEHCYDKKAKQYDSSWLELAQLYRRTGQINKAKEVIEKILSLNPKLKTAQRELEKINKIK